MGQTRKPRLREVRMSPQVTELVYNSCLGTQALLLGTGARFKPLVHPRAGAHLRQLARRREYS